MDSRAVELVIEDVLSLSKHRLSSLAFSRSLTREEVCVCLSPRRIETHDRSLFVSPFFSLSLSHIQSCVEMASRWEVGLSCQTNHQKATFYTLSVLSSGFLWANWCLSPTSVLLRKSVCPIRCEHRKYFVIFCLDYNSQCIIFPTFCCSLVKCGWQSPPVLCSGVWGFHMCGQH